MIHLSELQISQFADGGLTDADQSFVKNHLATCTTCQNNVLKASNEATVFQAALEMNVTETASTTIPAFIYPTSLSKFAMVNIATGLVIWLGQFLWKTIFGEFVINGASWLTSIYIPDLYNVVSATTLVYLEEGTAMFDTYLNLIVSCILGLTVIWLAIVYRRSQFALTIGLTLMIGFSAVTPNPANALEVRRDKNVVTVDEAEVISDTLLVASEIIIIKGTINGDLVATGQRIDIEGSVSGNVFAFAESIRIRGDIGGLLLSAGSSVELENSAVGGNLAIAGEKLSIDNDSAVNGNAVMAGNNATIEGPIGLDLFTFTETSELNSSVGQDMEAFGKRVRLLDNAHIAGSARLRIKDEEHFHRADGAIVDGGVEFLNLPKEFEDASPYAGFKFYLWQLARLASAVLVGLALLWFMPAFRSTRIDGGIEGLKTAGLGLLAIVGLPIIALVLAFTLIGLPFTILSIMSWLVFIYLAKIVVGLFVGKTLLANTHYANSDFAILLVGIAAVLVVVNIPAIGGIVSFVITILGVGFIVQQLIKAMENRDGNTPLNQ